MPSSPVTVTRIDPADAPNHVKLEVLDRGNAYNSQPWEWQDQGLVDQFGQIDSPVTEAHEICDLGVAAIVAQLVGQRYAYVRNTYTFTLGAEFSLLEPGDILTLTEPHIGLDKQPVRIKSIDEDNHFNLEITAEEFPGSLGTAVAPSVSMGAVPSSAGGSYNAFVDPGDVNPPCIFEPSSALTNGVAQIWIAASGGTNWGGSAVLISFDGTNYYPAGTIAAASPQGITFADLPAFGGANPDTADTLKVDLTVSAQTLGTNATDADAQAYRTLSLVTSAFTTTCPNAGELLAYGACAQDARNSYSFDLSYLYRGLYGMGSGSDAPSGSFITRIELNDLVAPLNAVLVYVVPTQYIGKTIHLKFLSYNTFGNEIQDAADVAAYAYVVTGRGYGAGTGGVPSTPTGLSATAIAGGISLSWNANPSTDNVTAYTLTRATSSGGPYTEIWTGQATNWIDSSAAAGTTYDYELAATNAAGTSAAEGPVSAAASPTNTGGRSITISTSSVTLTSGDSYVGITNSSGGAITVNLPSSPSANQTVSLADEGGNAGTYAWTIKNSGGATVGTVTVNSGGITLHWTGSIWQQIF